MAICSSILDWKVPRTEEPGAADSRTWLSDWALLPAWTTADMPVWPCCCSVAKFCLTLCDSMDRGTPSSPILHYLPEFAQTHIHWIGDAIYLSHPLLPCSPAFDLSQHEGLFQRVGSLHQVAKVLELPLQHQSFQWTFRVDFLTVLGTLKSLLQHHNSKASLALSLLYGPTLTFIHGYWKSHSSDYMHFCWQNDVSAS